MPVVVLTTTTAGFVSVLVEVVGTKERNTNGTTTSTRTSHRKKKNCGCKFIVDVRVGLLRIMLNE